MARSARLDVRRWTLNGQPDVRRETSRRVDTRPTGVDTPTLDMRHETRDERQGRETHRRLDTRNVKPFHF